MANEAKGNIMESPKIYSIQKKGNKGGKGEMKSRYDK